MERKGSEKLANHTKDRIVLLTSHLKKYYDITRESQWRKLNHNQINEKNRNSNQRKKQKFKSTRKTDRKMFQSVSISEQLIIWGQLNLIVDHFFLCFLVSSLHSFRFSKNISLQFSTPIHSPVTCLQMMTSHASLTQ